MSPAFLATQNQSTVRRQAQTSPFPEPPTSADASSQDVLVPETKSNAFTAPIPSYDVLRAELTSPTETIPMRVSPRENSPTATPTESIQADLLDYAKFQHTCTELNIYFGKFEEFEQKARDIMQTLTQEEMSASPAKKDQIWAKKAVFQLYLIETARCFKATNQTQLFEKVVHFLKENRLKIFNYMDKRPSLIDKKHIQTTTGLNVKQTNTSKERQQLGEGATGRVRYGVTFEGREVAVKKMTGHRPGNEILQEARILKEYLIWKQLSQRSTMFVDPLKDRGPSKGILPFLGAAQYGDSKKGHDTAFVSPIGKPFDVYADERGVSDYRKIAEAIDFIHGNEFAHMDIKHENILRSPEEDDLWIADFGLTTSAKMGSWEESGFTGIGKSTLGGTYPSPTCIKVKTGELPLDQYDIRETDVWAFGMMMLKDSKVDVDSFYKAFNKNDKQAINKLQSAALRYADEQLAISPPDSKYHEKWDLLKRILSPEEMSMKDVLVHPFFQEPIGA